LHWHKSALAGAGPEDLRQRCFSIPNNNHGWFIIYDILGSEKLGVEIFAKDKIKKFRCDQFGMGIYYYKIIDGKNLISYGKFSVIM
jgi:hypothetical protein